MNKNKPAKKLKVNQETLRHLTTELAHVRAAARNQETSDCYSKNRMCTNPWQTCTAN